TPLLLLVAIWRERVCGRARSAELGGYYGVGIVSGILMITRGLGVSPSHVLPYAVLPPVCWLLGYAAGAAFWSLARLLCGLTIMQDGTLCPRCAYSLIGNESMTCPECGRDFTFAELGTTESEFRQPLRELP